MKPIAERLWAKTDLKGPDECWEWLGWRHPFGHGQIGRGRRSEGLAYTHIIAWEVTFGPVPEGRHVCHKCDNPGCVNPSHLFLGSHADNMQDMFDKRRHSYGERHSKNLKDEDVLAIRRELAAGTTQQELATRYAVSRSLIGLIGRFERWRISAVEADTFHKLTTRPLPGQSDVCKRGHRYADVGFYRMKGGARNCKACHAERVARYMANGGSEKKRLREAGRR